VRAGFIERDTPTDNGHARARHLAVQAPCRADPRDLASHRGRHADEAPGHPDARARVRVDNRLGDVERQLRAWTAPERHEYREGVAHSVLVEQCRVEQREPGAGERLAPPGLRVPRHVSE
jgi:hypothetical protein